MIEARAVCQKFYPLIQEQIRKWYANKLNPFNLCPKSLIYWFIVLPFSAIGISITDVNSITFVWRQLIEPNETSYLAFNIIDIKSPFPLTLLVMFAAFGITIADAANRVLESVQMEQETEIQKVGDSLDRFSSSIGDLEEDITQAIEKEKHQTLVSLLDPFRLTPRLSVFFPVTEYTSIGFLTIDFRHIEFSVAQSIEPNGKIQTLIRFLDLYAPFPIQIGAMSLSLGLFVNGMFYKYGLATREEIISEIKRTLK